MSAYRCGKCSANTFLYKMERQQRIRLQKRMWELCNENRKLGGVEWKHVLHKFGLEEKDIWPTD